MKAYIQCCTSISHHATFGIDVPLADCLPAVAPQEEGDTLPAIDPNYKELIDDANMRRRMSHIVKMGVATSIHCINKSGCGQPEAIITATGMGGMADTEKFLNCIIDNHEQMLNPTNFIQSTGNTFGGQTGLLNHCHNYNVTYVHGGFSLESALTDALLQMEEEDIGNALVAAADEITPTEQDVMRRLGFWRNGNKMGEGAQAFLIGCKPQIDSLATITYPRMMRGPLTAQELDTQIDSLLADNNLTDKDIDVVLTGAEHDPEMETKVEDRFARHLNYKQWCGQYFTASSFGVWLAANMLKQQLLTDGQSWKPSKMKNILVYTETLKDNYTLMLLQAAFDKPHTCHQSSCQ